MFPLEFQFMEFGHLIEQLSYLEAGEYARMIQWRISIIEHILRIFIIQVSALYTERWSSLARLY